MALASAYSGRSMRRPIHTLIIAHFDSHGTATAAGRARILANRGENVEVLSKYPETGPQGLSSGQLKQLIDSANVSPQKIEVIDIPIDVRNPEASILTLRDLTLVSQVLYFDHHETDLPHLSKLHANGVNASLFSNAVDMAIALESFTDPTARELAVIGIIADRDSNILRIMPREEVESKYLPLANRLDVIVRSPNILGVATPGDIAKLLADQGLNAIPASIEYPPERLARELPSPIEEGSITVLLDWSNVDTRISPWVPKTLEQMLLLRNKYIAIAVLPGYNPRTRALEGYDVRVLKYWLAPPTVPTPEDVARELIASRALSGNVVGHADYVSLRYPSLEEARRAANIIFRNIEGLESRTARLVNEKLVADAIRRDFSAIMEKLTQILESMRQMYTEYLELKRKQVELLERVQSEREARAAD